MVKAVPSKAVAPNAAYRVGAIVTAEVMQDFMKTVYSDRHLRALNGDPEFQVSLMLRADEAAHTPAATSTAAAAPAERAKRTRPSRKGGPRTGGMYDVILSALSTGPKSTSDLREVLRNGGYAPGSAGSSLGRLKETGQIVSNENGMWDKAA